MMNKNTTTQTITPIVVRNISMVDTPDQSMTPDDSTSATSGPIKSDHIRKIVS
jgi:hypothetical protein